VAGKKLFWYTYFLCVSWLSCCGLPLDVLALRSGGSGVTSTIKVMLDLVEYSDSCQVPSLL
jgi:hypothetical protein